MFPLLFKLGPINIYSYGLMFMLAVLIATFLIMREAKKQGINSQIIWDFSFWIVLSGIIGARLAYIILNLKYFLIAPKEIFMLSHGGLVWYGGLMLGTLGGILYLKKNRLDILDSADLITPFIALAQSIGRIGCFLNGCCFGKVSSWGIYFPVHQQILIPTQLLSSFFLVVIFCILKILQNKPHQRGDMFLSYLVLYSVKRFFMEFLRNDSPIILLGLTGFQITSIFIGIISFSLILYNRFLAK